MQQPLVKEKQTKEPEPKWKLLLVFLAGRSKATVKEVESAGVLEGSSIPDYVS
jgi:hypothetical protein